MARLIPIASIVALLSAAACTPAEDEPAGPLTGGEAVWLLSRASLDLRGQRPSLADLQAVEADPTQVDPLIAGYLAEPGFGLRYAWMMASVWLTPLNEADHDQATYPVENELRLLQSLGEEPLRVLAEVAEEDLPYSDVVTGDWTVIDANLAELFPTDYPDGGTGWQVVHYTDGRPAAGVLATNGMWWRYDSTLSNANRGRANAITRIFTCHDYLEVQVDGDRDLDLLDEAAIADALRTNPACVACHATLDPIGSYLWGFYNHFSFSPAEQSHYHPERETLWEVYQGVPPGWQGTPGSTLSDLGRQVAEDPRFVECAAERTLEQLLSRPATLDDTTALTRHREAFLDGGLTLRSLVASVLADPAYRTPPDRTPADGVPSRVAGPRAVSAQLLTTSIEELTGYRFDSGGLEVFGVDLYGMRSLSGGLGPSWDTEATAEATATSVLVQERLAQAAADYVVRADLADPAAARLLVGVDGTERPDTDRARMAAVVVDLELRALGRVVAEDDPEVDRKLELWSAVYTLTGAPTDAWIALVTAVLREPDLVVY